MELIEIEELCRAKLWTKFPYADLRKVRDCLSRPEKKQIQDRNPDLDMYLAFIAGFATTATTVMNRPIEDLRRTLPILDKSFYQFFPIYEVLRAPVTKAELPDLFSHLEAADVLRSALARHIRSNLSD